MAMFLRALVFPQTAPHDVQIAVEPHEGAFAVRVFAHTSDMGTRVYANLTASGKHLVISAHSVGNHVCLAYTADPDYEPTDGWDLVLYVVVRAGVTGPKITTHAEASLSSRSATHAFGWKRDLARAVLLAEAGGRVPDRLKAAWMASFGAPVADWDESYIAAAREWIG